MSKNAHNLRRNFSLTRNNDVYKRTFTAFKRQYINIDIYEIYAYLVSIFAIIKIERAFNIKAQVF